MLSGREVILECRYIDFWRAYRDPETAALHIKWLQASVLNGNFERLADGRASWQFGSKESPPATESALQPMTPQFGKLQVASGLIHNKDVPLDMDLEVRLSLANAASAAGMQPTRDVRGAGVTATSSGAVENVFQVNATGRYRGLPMALAMVSTDVLPWAAGEAQPVSVPLTLHATVGRASFDFKGSATDASHLGGFTGQFSLKGPSLAAVGDVLGVTLPTTSAFRTDGVVVRKNKLNDDIWYVLIEHATVGTSRLNGVFTFEASRPVPLLSGQLGGSRLILAALGPSIVITPAANAKRSNGMVLPDRPYDLKALRAMGANVLIDMSELDLGSKLLEPLRPVHVHLQLSSGVLALNELDARTGNGNLKGNLALDGRQSSAIWNANLRWSGVQLERFIHQARANSAPPFVSGKMNGSTTLQGTGRSTAEILGSLNGKFHTELSDGSVSHLGVEIAGLDVAESLGVLFTGDKALPVQCAMADLVANDGIFRPRVMVLDTSDTAIWVEGSLSLATEVLDLRAVVMPKDFCPLTLRAPLRVRGNFDKPDISIDKGPMGRKLGAAFLRALVNPLAALIPLVDTGDAKAAERGAAGCKNLMRRAVPKRSIGLASITSSIGSTPVVSHQRGYGLCNFVMVCTIGLTMKSLWHFAFCIKALRLH